MNVQLTVIIPVYNEEEIIEKVIDDLSNQLRKMDLTYEIRVYNDGSKDNTLSVLRNIEKLNSNLCVIDKKNSGHGPTILQGFRDACESSEWVFHIDSDNEMPVTYFGVLWENRSQYDFLIGRRANREQKSTRKLISQISRVTVWLFYGKGVYDVNSPYRLMRTSCFKELFNKIPNDIFAPNLIISGFAGLKKLRIFQTEVPHLNRTTGEVSIKHLKLVKSAFKSYYQTISFRYRLVKSWMHLFQNQNKY